MESVDPRENLALVVRQIEPADAEFVSILTKQLGYDRTPAKIKRWIEELPPEQDRQAAFVACLGTEVVGWIEVSLQRHLQNAPFALIGGLVVKDGFRGRGIGRRLCAEVESWTWERGVEILRVTSRSTRAAAHEFYLGNGYSEVKTSVVFEKTRPK